MIAQLAPPETGAIVFTFEDLWTPEGWVRVRLWRNAIATDAQLFGLMRAPAVLSPSSPSVYIKLRGRLITKLPVSIEESENYFTETTTNEFTIGLYNTRSPADIISIDWDGKSGQLAFQDTSDGRLLFLAIKPTELTSVKGQFSEDEGEGFLHTATGEMQDAIGGEDYRWIHAKEEDPLLDERLNMPLDAEQIFDLKFIHAIHSGLEQCPVKPSIREDGVVPGDPITNVADSQSWYMPFDSDVETPHLPYVEIAGQKVVQGIDQLVTISTQSYNHRWTRHIHAYLWLKSVFDYTFGEDKWEMECDASPIYIQGNRLVDGPYLIDPSMFKSPISQDEGTAAEVIIAPPELGNIQNWILLPQALWGLYKNEITIEGAHQLESAWPSYHQSALDSIHEFCHILGWILLIEDNGEKAKIKFQSRLKPREQYFTGPVPVSAKPEAFPESENGIQVEGLHTFLNWSSADGWYDDLYAVKKGESGTPYKITEDLTGTLRRNVVDPQANPYTVPATAKKPAVLKTVVRLGGFQGGANSSILQSGGYYATFDPASPYIDNPQRQFPMCTPLVWSPAILAVDGTFNPDVLASGDLLFDFQPAATAYFNITKSDGSTAIISCDSLRQCLARFYATLFVKSARKYTLEESTISKFWLIDPATGDRIGKPSSKNIKLFSQRLFPDGHKYYVKRISRDRNTTKTSTEYLRVEFGNPVLDGDFGDISELTGSKIGDPPNDKGVRKP